MIVVVVVIDVDVDVDVNIDVGVVVNVDVDVDIVDMYTVVVGVVVDTYTLGRMLFVVVRVFGCV